MLRLQRFRTRNFRSITDSGWIDVNDVTAFVGINESGKSNLLLSLWKLNPAREGAIDPLADYPRDRYNEIRAMEQKPVFITALFSIASDLASKLSALTKVDPTAFAEVEISRRFDGKLCWSFPQCSMPRTLPPGKVRVILDEGTRELSSVSELKQEAGLKGRMLEALETACQSMGETNLNKQSFERLRSLLEIDRTAEGKKSKLGPIFDDVKVRLNSLVKEIERPDPTHVDGAWNLVSSSLPTFVYYSNYGNLDSEIYLPHVIDNLEREDLGEKEAAKARTLKVLFEFVNLRPEEILELGTEVAGINPSSEEIEKDARKKKEREVLLTSASTQLTTKFREWWKQGNYRFRFQADGNHFRIWVSDDIRTEEIELEGRSTGLQWFFSFYLIFLVESDDSHQGTILLLDEAGLSLHPLAQRDLTKFFDSLSNQILFTTHSPFLLEPDSLDRVRTVYTGEDGRTSVSCDLKASAKVSSASHNSIYPVHVALGLSVSDTFLIGCQPVIVEGVSDQRYLTAIKNYLIGRGKIAPSRDVVFLPAGGTGTKGIAAVVPIVCAKEERVPFVLLDSDKNGDELRKRLLTSVYKGAEDRVMQVCDFGACPGGEIEDLLPTAELARIVARYLPRAPGSDDDFDDMVRAYEPIVPQIENFAANHGLTLPSGWKVEVATQFKNRLPKLSIADDMLEQWTSLFEPWCADD